MVLNHLLSIYPNYCDPRHPLCSLYVPDSLFTQSHSKFTLVYLLAWHPPLHTAYNSSPNHCLLFAAHAHRSLFFCRETRITWHNLGTTEIMSCNPSLFLNPLFGIGSLSCSLTPHIHLTILISAWWSANLIFLSYGQILLPCNILLCTQLLYNLLLTINDISLW